VKLKLLHTPTQKSALDAVSLAFRDALNLTSTLAFENGKTSSPKTLQSLAYRRLRSELE
jgi:putative transposase